MRTPPCLVLTNPDTVSMGKSELTTLTVLVEDSAKLVGGFLEARAIRTVYVDR
jgi:hypothetical protein